MQNLSESIRTLEEELGMTDSDRVEATGRNMAHLED